MEIFSYKYSIPYLLCFGWLIFLTLLEFEYIKKNRNVQLLHRITLVFLLIFFCFRGFVYTDWHSYYPYFAQMPTLWSGDIQGIFNGFPKFEYGFAFYTCLIKSIFPNYHFWIFISSAIDIIILNIFFKKYTKYYVFAFTVFFIFGAWIIGFNLMRNIKAIMFFILSLDYLLQRKMLPYMLLNITGIFFHISAVVFLPLYFILHREFPKMLLWIIFIVGNVIFLFQIGYIQPVFEFVAKFLGPAYIEKVDIYFSSSYKPQVLTLGYVERFLSYVLVVLFYKKLKIKNPVNIIFANVFVIYFVFFFYFSEFVAISQRMSGLFGFSYWVLYPNLYEQLQRVGNRVVFVTVFFVFAIGKTIIGNDNILQRYDNLLFGIESYEERKEKLERSWEKIFKKPLP